MKEIITKMLWRIIEIYFYDEWVELQEEQAIKDAGVETLEELREIQMQREDSEKRLIYESGLADGSGNPYYPF